MNALRHQLILALLYRLRRCMYESHPGGTFYGPEVVEILGRYVRSLPYGGVP